MTTLTSEQKELVRRMIFGSFEEDWFVDGVLDNRDSTIAKRLNVRMSAVTHYTYKIVDEHFKNVNKRINGIK